MKKDLVEDNSYTIFVQANKQPIMYIARYATHIQEDIARNWSSWNFGQDGFEGTYEELEAAMNEALEAETSFDISGFEFWGSDIKKANIRELYNNYWVLVDDDGGSGRRGIFGIELNADTVKAAIVEAESRDDYWGEGVRFDASEATLVYSRGDIHIFEV